MQVAGGMLLYDECKTVGLAFHGRAAWFRRRLEITLLAIDLKCHGAD